MKSKFHIVSLGCPKNLTDSEVLMGHLCMEGYEYTDDPLLADVIVVNTCAFLSSARRESEQTIKEMAAYKKKGACKKLYVAGCLPKYEVRSKKLGVRKGRRGTLKYVDGFVDSIDLFDCHSPRIKATPPWTAYIKISEGCNNNCAYCLIPSIRGRLRSRKVADVIKEVKWLARRGVKEIIFVAQDTTAHKDFPEILKSSAKVKGVEWIRVMYAHPKHMSDRLIDVMAKEKKVLKYIDLPMQHSSDDMLKAMNRGYGRKHLESVIAKFRKKMPDIAIRTTFIVGFPGETQEDFEDLKDFIRKMKFDRVGVFPYSREKGTKAHGMKGQVPVGVARERHLQVMKIQERISREKNKGFIGKKMDVLVETLTPSPSPRGRGGCRYKVIGRTYRDAPEIDGKIKVSSNKELEAGQIVSVKITGAGAHDLNGKFVYWV